MQIKIWYNISMQEFSHKCIKCKIDYKDGDQDDYYCTTCNNERLRIAKEIDAKIALRPHKKVKSAMEIYDEAPKFRGFMIVRN